MSDDTRRRLSCLKDELDCLEAQPWGNIESWIAKATPIVRSDWPEHLDAFRDVAAEPKWIRPRATMSELRDGIRPTLSPSESANNEEKAESAKRDIMGFLDGLLVISANSGGRDTEHHSPVVAEPLTRRAGFMQRIGAMIGSPSDAGEERQAITDAILRWNAVNRDKGIIIEPVKWETHATPGLQGRPQGMINSELIPISDILLAVFRSRAGSPTGKELSGTIEEIREFMRAGKYVVLYFYEGDVDIRTIDPAQLITINEFRKEIQQQGLTAAYKSVSELREHILCHMTSIVGRLATPDPADVAEQNTTTSGKLELDDVQASIAKLKRCIADDGLQIELHDLITQETEQARQAVFDPDFLKTIWPIQADSLARWLKECEVRMDRLLHLHIYGCRWAKPEHNRLWIRSLERLGSISQADFNNAGGADLTFYPALLLLYSGGLAAVAADNYTLLNGLLSDAACSVVQRSWSRDQKAAWIMTMLYNLSEVFSTLTPKSGFPVSDYLYGLLRDRLRPIEPDDRRYDKLFDRFECLSAISYADTFGDRNMLIGRFGRQFWYPEAGNVMEEIEIELGGLGNNWPPLKGGICGGSIDRFRRRKQQLDEGIKNTRRP